MTDLPWEDNLLERKTESDLKDLLKTLVAFANSVRPGHTAVILIGEKDDDTVQGVTNPDKIQKTIRNTCDKIYPPILWKSEVYEKEEKHCVRVEIEYDGETPHFGGTAWVRKGSETIKASDKVFQKLIELRLDKVRELEKWIGIDKRITVAPDPQGIVSSRASNPHLPVRDKFESTLLKVNNFWATFLQANGKNMSMPLEKIILSWDDTCNCLKLLIKP
jgi:hypothetical protein